MKSHGFTLIELMIVVAIIGILAATAVPLYRAYIDEAARSEARTTLADIASKEEAFHSAWNRYIPSQTPDAQYQLQSTSYGTRSIQEPANNAERDAWAALGISSGSAGLWDGPVYFRYKVLSPATNANYRVCARRWITTTATETFSLSDTNRRAYVENGPDC